MRSGASGSAERVLQLVEGPRPAVVVRRPAQAVAGELLGRVPGDGLHAASRLSPALRHPDRDLRPALLASATPRTARGRPTATGTSTCLGTPSGGRSQYRPSSTRSMSSPARGPRPCRARSPCDRRPGPRARRTPARPPRGRRSAIADHVEVLALGRPPSAASRWPCAPTRAGRASGPPARTRARRRRLASDARAACTIASVSPSRKSISSCTSSRRSSSAVDLADARARALLDVEEQARPTQPLVAAELVVRAGADGERPQQQVERLADGVGVAVGPEVADALALASPA